MKMVQVQFERKVRGGVRHTTAWVDKSWRLKPGNVVSFNDERHLVNAPKWTVVSIGTIVEEYESIHNKWHVGGL
jgi:hypothetical protein